MGAHPHVDNARIDTHPFMLNNYSSFFAHPHGDALFSPPVSSSGIDFLFGSDATTGHGDEGSVDAIILDRSQRTSFLAHSSAGADSLNIVPQHAVQSPEDIHHVR